jgi:hypothetical protein
MVVAGEDIITAVGVATADVDMAVTVVEKIAGRCGVNLTNWLE